MGSGFDELEARRLFKPLPTEASNEEVVDAVNGLARAARTHSVELEGIRLALQEHGSRIEMFCLRIERALGAARDRATDPAPKPEGE